MMSPAFTFLAFFLCLGSSSDLLDVCTCADTDGYAECVMDSRPVVIVLSDCVIRGLRLTGEGYLVDVQTSGGFQEIIEVAVERTTLTCEEGLEQFPVAEVYLAGTKCTRRPNVTTTTTTEPPIDIPRPPAIPQDDDNQNNDDGDNTTTTTANTTTTTTTTNSSITELPKTTTSMTRITVISSTSIGGWWIVIGVSVVVCGFGVIVVCRVRMRRVRRASPVQCADVSSTTSEAERQRTYVLRPVPRSPRNRRSESMESVVLYAVTEDL